MSLYDKMRSAGLIIFITALCTFISVGTIGSGALTPKRVYALDMLDAGANSKRITPNGKISPARSLKQQNALQQNVQQQNAAALSALASEYFEKSVFVGDSIMVGFRNYALSSKTSCLSHAKFLAKESYSLRNGLRESSDLHPTYNGKKQPVWKSIAMMDVDRVFIMFGMNDIFIGNEQTIENLDAMAAKIVEAKPGIQINIISMTYTLKDKSKGHLNNDNIRAYNAQVAAECAAKGWKYWDLCSVIADAEGNLKKEYCSDNFVHHTNASYANAWEPFFKNIAIESVNQASK